MKFKPGDIIYVKPENEMMVATYLKILRIKDYDNIGGRYFYDAINQDGDTILTDEWSEANRLESIYFSKRVNRNERIDKIIK